MTITARSSEELFRLDSAIKRLFSLADRHTKCRFKGRTAEIDCEPERFEREFKADGYDFIDDNGVYHY